MHEEEELGQLGVLEHQTDSPTEFGLRARWLESTKAFVRQDCSPRLARAGPRQSGPIDMEVKAEGPRRHGPGRIVGFDLNVWWTLNQGTPVAVPTGRARLSKRFWFTWCWNDRVSERTDQSRAARQPQGS